jgi:hypothetical protein
MQKPVSITHARTDPEPIIRVAREVQRSVTAHATAAPSPPRIAIERWKIRAASVRPQQSESVG